MMQPTYILMRHAARDPIPPGTLGNELPITEQGRRDAAAWGSSRGGNIRRIHSSPVDRCVQTCEAVLGAHHLSITLDTKLGAPGIFVNDPEEAGRTWLRLGAKRALAAILGGEQLPGWRDPRVAARELVEHMLGRDEPGIHLFVTHDSILAPVLAHAFDVDVRGDGWPRFLDTLTLHRSGDGVVAHYRSLE